MKAEYTDFMTNSSCLHPLCHNSEMWNHLVILVLIFFVKSTPSHKKTWVCTQGIIQKKSESGSRALPLVTFDKKSALFPKIVLFRGKTIPKVLFFKVSGRCPKILDYALVLEIFLISLSQYKYLLR